MASLEIDPADLAPFATIDPAKAQAMVEDARAWAIRVAPCLATDTLTPAQASGAKAVLRQALLRWHEAGAGGVTQQQQTIGPASWGQSFDNRQSRKGMFWPSEIVDLQQICREVDGRPPAGRAFEVDTTPPSAGPRVWVSPIDWVPFT